MPNSLRSQVGRGCGCGTIDENSEIVKTPAELAENVSYLKELRKDIFLDEESSYEVAVDGITQPGEVNLVREYKEAGATWWFEAIYELRGNMEELKARLRAGPPR